MLGQRINNVIQTAVLLAAIISLFLLLGWFFAGIYGILWTLFAGVFPLVVSMRTFPALILKMYRARRLGPDEAYPLTALVEELGRRAGLTVPPAVYCIASSGALVFSTGWGNDSSIAVTGGLLRLLSRRELTGVLAHEISHIRNRDTWVMSFADVVSRVTGIISFLGQLLILINLPLLILRHRTLPWLPLLLMIAAPIFSALLQLALSRTREYSADLDAVQLSGDPAGLASALLKLESAQKRSISRSVLSGLKWSEPALLRSHPRTELRIRRLQVLEDDLRTDDMKSNVNHSPKGPRE